MERSRGGLLCAAPRTIPGASRVGVGTAPAWPYLLGSAAWSPFSLVTMTL